MASSRYNNNGRNGNRNGNGKSETKLFCAVCHAAGRPGYDTHYVRADKFDRSSPITCPYLMSIVCRNCGGAGHTESYCTASGASRASSVAAAASLARVRLPPISSSSSSSHHHYSSKQPPRIVFPALEKEEKEREFPQLPNNRKPQSTTTLPPLPLSFSRFRNDEPLLKRGPPDAAQASPVHSPAAAPSNKIVYNKRGNAFADLASSSDDEELSPIHSPPASPDAVGRYRPTKPLSWPSLAPLLPPLEFKPRKTASGASAVPKKDKKKMWGDSDSEDDEEFLKRGLE